MTAAPRGSGMRRWLLPMLWLGMTIAIAATLPFLPWRQAAMEARRASPGWILAAVLANLAILPLWAQEWRLLVPGTARVTVRRMFEVVAMTAAVLNSVPFLAGEISAVALLMARAGLSRGAALSVLAMDQLLVAFAKVAVLIAAALVAPIPGWLRGGVITLIGVLTAMLGGLLPLAHRWRAAQTWLLRTPSRWRIALADLVSWGGHFDALREGRRAWRSAAFALTKKLAELAAVLAVQLAFGLAPSVPTALLVLAALALSTLIPVAPANLGVYEATVFGVYRYSGLTAELALGLALIQHVCFLLPPLATGYLMLSFQQLRLRRLRAS